MSAIQSIKNKVNKTSYKIIKPILFSISPETTHDIFTELGELFGKYELTKKSVSAIYNYQDDSLKQKILGIEFKNPIGLAAGFDYDARLTQILPKVGFGFNTIGSITYKKYKGNPSPMLGRLPKSRSLLVNKGLKNKGTKKVLESIKDFNFEIPLGISIAKTNSKKNCDDKNAILDYYNSLKLCEKYSLNDYYEINISCPNAFGGEAFTTPQKLDSLLKKLDEIKTNKPIFLKMPVDFSAKQTEELCETAKKHNIQGLIFGNLTKKRDSSLFDKEEIKKAGKGNFSGFPTQEKSNELIKFAYKKYKNKFVIIGCGGVFSPKDAYKKIKLGASLVQMITGMIFQGPSIIGEINQELAEMLKKDKFKNISQAVGADNK